MHPKLFAGIYPEGMVYADRRTKNYRQIAFLSWRTLKLKIDEPNNSLMPDVVANAKTYQDRKGEEMFLDDSKSSSVILGCESPESG